MIQKALDKHHQDEITNLFLSVFTDSEGEKEGVLIGDLVSKLSSRIDHEDIICFGIQEAASIIGAIFFTRLRLDETTLGFMLSPVAVSTEHQRNGIGQALISYGLQELKKRAVDVAITYGDPSFYAKVGFQTLPESIIQAPLKLSMPEGWLGQSLTGKSIPITNGRPTCIEEFNDPVYW